MLIFPAIDLYEGKAVRLYKGNYAEMTVYNENPVSVAQEFQKQGATHLHLVDLEGAKTGETPNLDVISDILNATNLFTEVGGGIRSMETVEKYLSHGVNRVILGTAAVTNETFLQEAVKKCGKQIAVGVDIKDGMVAIKGWTEVSAESCFDFCEKLQKIGVKTIICTDISKDGLLSGTNLELYKELSEKFSVDIVASGGVTTLDDVKKLAEMGMYGAILGKALYTGNIDLKAAVELTKGGN